MQSVHTAYLGLGCNLGNREATMREAIAQIEKRIGVVVRQSAFIETKPWGFDSPNMFLNACVCVRTSLSPADLLRETQVIECDMGRTHKSVDGHYADRTIDIDILLFDHQHIQSPTLIVPHPQMWKRDFVMQPLREICSQELLCEMQSGQMM